MDLLNDPLNEEIIAENDNDPEEINYHVMGYVKFNCVHVIITTLVVYLFWKCIFHLFISRWKKMKEEENETVKAKKDLPLNINREEGRMAAVERLQRNYNEEILKMKKITEEKEEKRRKKYLSDLSQISPGRKLNE